MYKYLAGRLKQLGIRKCDLAYMLGLSATSVSNRFTGTTPWSIDEMYKIMDICQAPAEQLHIYFPPKRSSRAESSPNGSAGFPIIVTIKIDQSTADSSRIKCSVHQA